MSATLPSAPYAIAQVKYGLAGRAVNGQDSPIALDATEQEG
jgi:hypothetical protein